MSGALSSSSGSMLNPRIQVVEKTKTLSTTSGTTITSGVFSMIAGRVYIVMLAFDPSGASVPTVTVSDTANTYTGLSTLFPSPATTTAGGGVITQSFITTAAATTSITITATFSAAITAKVMTVIELNRGTTTQRNVVATSRGTTIAPNYVSPSGNIKDIVLSVLAQETNLANTAVSGSTSNIGGLWSAFGPGSLPSPNATAGGNSKINISLSYQFKVLTVTGSQAITWGTNSTDPWACQAFAIQSI